MNVNKSYLKQEGKTGKELPKHRINLGSAVRVGTVFPK